jgi:hypothetical protein
VIASTDAINEHQGETMRISLARTVGLTAAVASLAAGGLAIAHAGRISTVTPALVVPTPALVTPASAAATSTPPLQPGQVTYQYDGWGVSGPRYESGCGAQVPRSWPKVKLADYNAKFSSSNDLWVLRINCVLPGTKTRADMVNERMAALRGTKGFRVLSIVDGLTPRLYPNSEANDVLHTKTMTYTYTGDTGGTRLVISRWATDYGRPTTATVEITAAGRKQDLVGLQSVVARATKTFYRAG